MTAVYRVISLLRERHNVYIMEEALVEKIYKCVIIQWPMTLRTHDFILYDSKELG